VQCTNTEHRVKLNNATDYWTNTGGAAIWRRTHDRKVAGSTPGWGAIK